MLKTTFRGGVFLLIMLLFLLIMLLFTRIVHAGLTQKIYTIPTARTYLAQKDEFLIIHPSKYPNTTFSLLIKDFGYLKRTGNGFTMKKDSNNVDAVLTTLQYNHNITVWDINDTQGVNISIHDNNVYDLQFKSLFIMDDILVFNLTEIGNNAENKGVKYNPLRPFFYLLISITIILVLFEAYYKNEKINNM